MNIELSTFKEWAKRKDYLIYEDGRIYSKLSNRFLKPGIVVGGYKVFTLIDSDGVRNNVYAHVEVAKLWVDNPSNLPFVNHKDEDTSNNHYSNLEWCTFIYNIEYSQADSCTLLSPEGIVTSVFNINKFCKEHGLSAGNISEVRKGSRSHHKGWTVYLG